MKRSAIAAAAAVLVPAVTLAGGLVSPAIWRTNPPAADTGETVVHSGKPLKLISCGVPSAKKLLHNVTYSSPWALDRIAAEPRKTMANTHMNEGPAAGSSAGIAPVAEASSSPKGERKVLYYRNPMGLPDTSKEPKKDWMGMDYIAVYEGEEEDDGTSVKVSLDKVQRSGVRTEAAEMRRLVRPVRAPAVAKYDERTMHAVTLRADAFIEKLHVNETGAQVKAGQPLFRIFSAAMLNAQSDVRVELANPGRDRGPKGAQQRLENLDLPKSVVDELRRTGEPVVSIEWPAPASGVVIKKNVVEGQMARMGEPLFMLADLSKIWVIADVTEQDIGLVKVGQPVQVRFRAYPGEIFSGKVSFILQELEMATRTAKVRIEIDNADLRIKAEMYADAEIDAGAGAEPSVAVPNSAVINSGERQVVLIARGEGRFEPRPVKLGIQGENYTEIREGVAAGEQVVVSANFLIDAESNLKAALKAFAPDTAVPVEPKTPEKMKPAGDAAASRSLPEVRQ